MYTFKGAEYGADFDRAIFESELHWALSESLRADVSEEYLGLVDEFIRDFAPKLLYKFGTPQVHLRRALRRERKFWSLMWKMLADIYPDGKEGPDLAHEQRKATLPKDILWAFPRNYRFVAGQLLEFSPAESSGYGFPVAITRSWLPAWMAPDQIEADEYHKECVKLQATPAGRKAKALLLENLRDDQVSDYYRYGFFHVVNRDSRNHYLVERGFTNGNIMKVKLARSIKGAIYIYPVKTYCFHAEDPHPIDDVILAQKLAIENHEDEFLAKANPSSPPYNGRYPIINNSLASRAASLRAPF